MEYRKVYALYERHSKDGEFWFKSAGKRPDILISDEWYKVNNIRCQRFNELRDAAISCDNLKSQDLCDEIYSILYKDGMLIELVIETKYLR